MSEINMKKWDSYMFPDMTDKQLNTIQKILLNKKPKKDDFYMNLWWIGCSRALLRELIRRRKKFSNI